VKVLALDLSSSTGWAVLSAEGDGPFTIADVKLEDYGVLQLPKKVKEYADGEYPWAIYSAAQEMARLCYSKVVGNSVDKVVVECVNSAKARFSQQYLDILHGFLWFNLQNDFDKSKLFYVDSSEWRRVTGSQMTKEAKKANAKLSAAKRKSAERGQKLDKKKLGIRGKLNKKHMAIARANELFLLELIAKDDDVADAIMEGLSYFLGARPTTY
jgi:hypothetical protein